MQTLIALLRLGRMTSTLLDSRVKVIAGSTAIKSMED